MSRPNDQRTADFVVVSTFAIIDLGLSGTLEYDALSPTDAALSPIQKCRRYFITQAQTVRMWPPEYITFTSPLLTPALVMAAAANTASDSRAGIEASKTSIRALEAQSLKLIIGRFAELWGIGSFCLGQLCSHGFSNFNSSG